MGLRGEVIGDWRTLCNKLYDLYFSPNIVQVIKSRRKSWAGHVACMVEEERCIQGFGEESRGKIPFGRPRHRWEDNIKMDL